MSNIWVLGGHGLVGEALQKEAPSYNFLKRAEFEIGQTTQFPFLVNDIIIDLVPPPSPRMYPDLEAAEFHKRFTQPHLDFIENVKRIGIKQYIFLSSGGAIYGRTQEFKPFSEGEPLKPISHYGESKKRIEESLVNSGINFTILRPSNIFNSISAGKKQSGVIGIFLKQFSKNQPIEVFGSLQITKDYIASEDVARAIVSSLDTANNQIINIGTGKGFSIEEIIASLEKRFKLKVPIELRPTVANDIQWMILDASKAKNILKFSANIDLLNWIETSTNQQF